MKTPNWSARECDSYAGRMFTRLLDDTRFTFRAVRARPALFLLSALTVALVVGAGSAVFAVANAAFVRPLPFPDAGRLARIYLLPPGVRDLDQANPLHPLDFVRLRERLTVGRARRASSCVSAVIGGDGDPESVPAASVSAGVFRLLGATPAHGRTFTAEEDLAGAPVVVLSDALWRRRFGGRPEAMGQFLDVDRVRHQIVGVMRPDFEPAYVRSELWTPLGIHAGHLPLPNATYIVNVVRLASGTTLAEFEAEVQSILADRCCGISADPQRLDVRCPDATGSAVRTAADAASPPSRRGGGARHHCRRESDEPDADAGDRAAPGGGASARAWRRDGGSRSRRDPGGAHHRRDWRRSGRPDRGRDATDVARPRYRGRSSPGADWCRHRLASGGEHVRPVPRRHRRRRCRPGGSRGRAATGRAPSPIWGDARRPHPRQHRTRARLVVAQTALACLLLSAVVPTCWRLRSDGSQ